MTVVRIAFLAAPEGVEQLELTVPWQAVIDGGGEPRLLSTESGRIQAFRHLDRADSFSVDETVDTARAEDYDGLVLPGGVANPDALRMNRRAVALVKDFFESGRPVAAICHAPWLLAEADVLLGRTVTSYPSLRTDLRNAGAEWVDEPVVICEKGPNVLVTSRRPRDLKAFCSAFITEFGRARA